MLLALLAERRLLAGQNAELVSLMRDVLEPPVSEVGALPVNSFLKKKERGNLAAALSLPHVLELAAQIGAAME